MGEVGAAERDGEEEPQGRSLRIHLRWLPTLLDLRKLEAADVVAGGDARLRALFPALPQAGVSTFGALLPGGQGEASRMPSGPGEFHPEPLTDSGLDTLASSGSCHRTKA